jgi:hypothetical protein
MKVRLETTLGIIGNTIIEKVIVLELDEKQVEEIAKGIAKYLAAENIIEVPDERLKGE